MGLLGSLVQRWTLGTQAVTPASVTAALLGTVGLSVRPGGGDRTYPGGKKAGCCVSLDYDVTRESRADANRKGTHLLLQLAEEHGVPLTWGVCGMTAERDPESLRAIQEAGVSHEIASHTYAHLRVDTASPEALEEDHRQWGSIVKGAAPRTFIFPYNREGNFETLKRLGFDVFRGERRQVSPPFGENGLFNVPPVMYLGDDSDGTVRTAKGLVDLCIRCRSVFHLWSHPWNLSGEGDPEAYSRKVIAPIFSYLKEKEGSGELGLYTMGQLAESARAE